MEDEKDRPKDSWDRAEDRAIGILYSFIERKADRKFWIKTIAAMIAVTTLPAIIIAIVLIAKH
jgi:hypothetical protein